MALKPIKINIDTLKRDIIPIEGINVGDDVKLNVIVKEGKVVKDLTGQTISVAIKRNDGTIIEKSSDIENTNLSEGEFAVVLKDNIFNRKGLTLFQARFTDTKGVETTAVATLDVGGGIINDKVIENSSQFETLKSALEITEEYRKQLEDETKPLELQYANELNEKADKKELNVEKARIDMLTQIKNGQTEGNSELLDIRIGTGGETYNTAGNAVREQFKKVVQLEESFKDVEITTQDGLVSSSDRTISSSEGFVNCYIDVEQGEVYKITGYTVNTVYCGCFLVTPENTLKSRVETTVGAFNSEITIPSGVNKMYLNGKKSEGGITIKKKTLESSSSFWKDFKAVKEKLSTFKKNKYFVKKTSEDEINVYIGKYNNDNDLMVLMRKKGGNKLFDFRSWMMIPNKTDIVSTTNKSETRVSIIGNETDWISPHIFFAKENADGDFPEKTNGLFTGGWHMYNQKTSGDYTPTARTVLLKVFADGKEIKEVGAGSYAEEIKVVWVNRVQASNTQKQDGSGRECIEEKITVKFGNGNIAEVEGEITALEDVEYKTYYGLQMYNELNGSIYYVGSRLNKKANPNNVISDSLDKYCTGVKLIGEEHTFEMNLRNKDITNMYGNKGTYSSLTSQYKKSYMVMIKCDDTSDLFALEKGNKMFWSGEYNIYPTIK